MVLQEIGGGGFDYVQDTTPTAPDIGETWYDESVANGSAKIYADLGGGAAWRVLPTQQELQSGRTRELLLLLQDRPVPEIQDPLNLQTGLSSNYEQVNGDYQIGSTSNEIVSRGSDTNDTSDANTGTFGIVINPNENLSSLTFETSSLTVGITRLQVHDDSGSVIASTTFDPTDPGDLVTINYSFSSGTNYWITGDNQGNGAAKGYAFDDTGLPYSGTEVDIVDGIFQDAKDNNTGVFRAVVDVVTFTNATVTDAFSAPTSGLTDFQAWNAIRAEDVTAGGSTSADPVEFEILDSTDTALNTTRIPASEIADSAFKLRDREWTTTASAGQTQFTIPTTGDGGNYGIPILSVVTVEQNGNVLDGAWEFDGTDTVTLDSGASDGDTITVSYDLDVFDSTLQPRAYLSRESGSEASPSISHFRYEYVI